MDASQKTILVIGGAGFIGTHTVVQLLNECFKVLIINNLNNSVIEVVDQVKELVVPELSKKLQLNLGDSRNRDDLVKLFSKTCHLGLYLQMTYNECNLTSVELDFTCNNWLRFDVFIHFASLKAIGESFDNPRQYFDNNLIGTINPYEIMAKYNCKKMVFSSSATVYGQPDKIPCVEDFELRVMNPYVCFELLLHMNEKGDSINASYYHIVNPSSNTIVAAEVTYSFFTNVNTITVGTQHVLDSLTTIKDTGEQCWQRKHTHPT
ncbi:hypothetical protein GOBAR_DD04024 [Gossypium barbadense]|nr:hypothetical protein GOBAR_DD04024 [Gossypium barbadense]